VDQDVRQFREALQRERRGRQQPYSAAIQQRAVAYWQRREAEGAWVSVVAEELGLHARTLARWVRRRARPASFRRVTVATALRAERPALVVVTPQGLRIEGLDVAQLAQLLDALP
jgi:transposase-like protein